MIGKVTRLLASHQAKAVRTAIISGRNNNKLRDHVVLWLRGTSDRINCRIPPPPKKDAKDATPHEKAVVIASFTTAQSQNRCDLCQLFIAAVLKDYKG